MWLFTAVCAARLAAQNQPVMTTISATAGDAQFQVDGQWITGQASFAWPEGSKHTLSIATAQFAGATSQTRYLFEGWSHWANDANDITITADMGITSYTANLATQFALNVVYFACPANPPCNAPGTIWIDQQAYEGNTEVWVDAAESVTIAAQPGPGFVFTGWAGSNFPPVYTFTANAPITFYPVFATARSIQLNTFPSGLQVLADREPVATPITFEWGWNTVHQLGVTSPQRDSRGLEWVFQSWSDGGAMNHTYQVQPLITTDTVVAQFARAVPISVLSQPAGLTLTVDGAAAVTPKNFLAAPGETHTVTASPSVLDASGAPWVFQSWSNGSVAATQSLTVTLAEADSGIALTAIYAPRSRIEVVSNPSGLAVTVDGASCATPCDIERNIGTTVQLSAPASVTASAGVRYDFLGWTGATLTNGTLTAAAGFETVTARYSTSYQLALSTSPADPGTWQLSPASSDGFFLAGTAVAVLYTPSTGAKFQNWALDLSGPLDPATIVMNAPHVVRAIIIPAPAAPPPLQVANAAGSDTTVAPGSIASLFGSNLADGTASSTANPLPQSMGGVSLVCAGRILPLLYVSPGQINFQVASDLTPGPYQLEIHRSSGPIREAAFTVARDAPGLFAAMRPDGSVPTEASPAHAGDRLLLYGTGFGPYTQPVLDGFSTPGNPPIPLVDGVAVTAAGQDLTPDFAGAAPALTGIVRIEIQLPENLTAEGPFSLQVVVGGVTSNTLAVPFR